MDVRTPSLMIVIVILVWIGVQNLTLSKEVMIAIDLAVIAVLLYVLYVLYKLWKSR